MNIVLFRPSSVRHSRFLLFTCPSAVMVKNRTLNRVWRRLAWSFNSAFEGINPVIGESNRPLIGGDLARAGTPLTSTCRKFALVELRGDWEWHRDVWRTTATWKAVKTCFQCPAVSKGPSEYLYHNIGDDWPMGSWGIWSWSIHCPFDSKIVTYVPRKYMAPLFIFPLDMFWFLDIKLTSRRYLILTWRLIMKVYQKGSPG